MNLQQLKASGGIVDGNCVKKVVQWTHLDPAGDSITDAVTVHVRRQSFGVIEQLFASDGSEQSRNARYIAASVRLGQDADEALSYEDAYSLEPGLGFLLLNAVNEVNGTGGAGTKN
ncbi:MULTISPECIES: phage tail assembly chaperone family protein, TAC [unclassified Pseudomonas]|jgi:hypothetical protein|uniref:phage tail assembly chaperone family protein, TAC n=1 Tax=unclassified Pseudomonas TaxID=196821 RepID=UPI0007552EEA|nr:MULTISPECIES: phage tail assembly chaperone family protein, TAC [unclassified Pseudomonas]KVV01759.1 hypothetical protein AP060_03479 [Pseudomonas sp. TAD18]KVV03329.1 hypothetical protein AP059_03713 [Pseudomonas sp. TAA207]